MPPEQTWAWLESQLPRYGITRLADVTGLDEIGIPVFVAIRPAAKTLSVAQGKGVTPLLAKISAAMEAVETWHAENVPPETGPIPARQLRDRPHVGAAMANTWWHEDLPVPWLTGEGLVTGTPHAVPLGCVRLDHTFDPAWSPPVFRADSNGLASGNTVPEATLYALCELAERDTVHSSPVDVLDQDSVTDEVCRDLLRRLARVGRVDVRYSGGLLGVPCFAVVGSAETVPFRFAGYGCHPDPAVALARALTEAAQSRLTAITGSRDDDEQPFRAVPPPAESSEPRGSRVDWNSLRPTVDDLADVIAKATGHEPVRVVLPSPTGIPVVKVIAPGLRRRP